MSKFKNRNEDNAMNETLDASPSVWRAQRATCSTEVPYLIPHIHFFPPKFERFINIFSGNRKLFGPQTMIFHIPENCRLQT